MVMHNKSKNTKNGFTLIELLVVIAIIALLSTVVIASVKTARDKAKFTITQNKMAEFAKVASIAEQESGNTLGEITGTFWSAGQCSPTPGTPPVFTDLNNLPKDHVCYIRFNLDATNIVNATKGMYPSSTITYLSTDAWGRPFLLDENQGEAGLISRCGIMDRLQSVGADGLVSTSDDIIVMLPLADTCP